MRWCFLMLMVCMFCSCGHTVNKTDSNSSTAPKNYLDTLTGTYTGDFGGSEINIILTHVTGKHAVGYNLHKGLRRNISGVMSDSVGKYFFTLNEPGDHQFDGVFHFTIDSLTLKLSGTWSPLNDKSLHDVTYTLTKQKDTGIYAYTNFWSDSTSEIGFKKDGQCVYESYPVVNGKPAEQMTRVTGSWSAKDSVITVFWNPNQVFPNRQSIFTKITLNLKDTGSDGKEYNYTDESLQGEGRKFSMNKF